MPWRRGRWPGISDPTDENTIITNMKNFTAAGRATWSPAAVDAPHDKTLHI